MIEIYLFINPLGSICYHTEKQILDFVENGSKKIQFRFIPLVNLRTIGDLMKREGKSPNDIKERNRLFETIFSASLDYKAAQLQGKKKGRHFLLRLQEAVGCHGEEYSKKLVEKLVVETGGDLEMFLEDRQSEFVKEAFYSDQQIAREMDITQHPSAVVYNFSYNREFGVLVEGKAAMSDIFEICHSPENIYDILEKDYFEKDKRRLGSNGHLLRLV
ncbi:GTP pyrophosphokinase [Enterococcus sp. JM4C]|uniref:ClpXP adapter SpxH family protein n=1 Tax=Candidatus Enterococcus huntleyi TaxID=1857217 RepID=UPI001379B19F|nr:GTP pyrophosphokinase [Enterococcus sp. JM4C]